VALVLVAAVFVLTLPFGAWRATTRRYSLWWFLAIHVPIPFIFLLRVEAGYSYTFIPFTVTACVAGQLVGGSLGARFLRRRRSDTPQVDGSATPRADSDSPVRDMTGGPQAYASPAPPDASCLVRPSTSGPTSGGSSPTPNACSSSAPAARLRAVSRA